MIVVAATQNKHKILEIDAIMKAFGYKVISRSQAGVPILILGRRRNF